MKTLSLAALTALAAAGCVLAVPTAATAAPPACTGSALAITASRGQGFAGPRISQSTQSSMS